MKLLSVGSALETWQWVTIAVVVAVAAIAIVLVWVWALKSPATKKKSKSSENPETQYAYEPAQEEYTTDAQTVKLSSTAKSEETAKPAPAAKTAPAAKPAPAPAPAYDYGAKVYHITKRKDDGQWAIKAEGATRALKLFRTQAEAVAYSKQLAKNQGARVIVHKEDGSISKLSF